MSRLKDTYTNEIVAALTKKFGYKNIMEVPKIDKIVVVKKGKVRRAKLYYLRGRTGKAAKIKEIL